MASTSSGSSDGRCQKWKGAMSAMLKRDRRGYGRVTERCRLRRVNGKETTKNWSVQGLDDSKSLSDI